MSGESYDLHLTTLSPIHIGSGKSYSGCEFVPAKAKSKGQIVKIIKRVNLTNYYSSLSDDKKDTFLASLTNSNFELKQFDKKIKKDFVRYQCIDNSRVDFINEVQEHIKTSDKLYIPGSSIKGAIRTAIFYDLLTEDDMDKIGRDISNNRRNNSFLSNDLLKKHFTSGFGNDAQYNIFRFMQVADTTTTNLPRIEQVLAVMATDDRRKNQFYSRHGKVVKSYLETIGANKNLEQLMKCIFEDWFVNFNYSNDISFKSSELGEIPSNWNVKKLRDVLIVLESGKRPKGGISNIDDGIPSIGAENILGLGKFNYSKNKLISHEFFSTLKKGVIQDKDVLLYKDGAQLGRKSLFMKGFPFDICCINEHVFRLQSNDEINQFYLYLWLDQEVMTNEIINLNSNSAQPGINQNDVKSLPILVPELKIISKFNKIISPMMNQIFDNALKINKLTNLRDTLLPKLMSGEIDVSKINCDLELKYNYMKYLFNQIHTPMSKSIV